MRAALLALVISLSMFTSAPAQPTSAPIQRADPCKGAICWEIVNRFRLFQRRADFERHEKGWRDGVDPILAAERRLNAHGGAGWAAGMVDHLCFVEAQNVAPTRCWRDGVREFYLAPRSFAVRIWAKPSAVAADSCVWSFPGERPRTQPIRIGDACTIELRVSAGVTTRVALAARAPDGATVADVADAAPRDILVAGVGDSFTSGEGNPDRPVRPGKGMCFNRIYSFGVFGGYPPDYESHRDEIHLVNDRRERIVTPARLGAQHRDCESTEGRVDEKAWTDERARWLFSPCHRSLYSHQLRAALALAIVAPHRSVTYIPLGCTGATIARGLIEGQPPREKQLRAGRYAARVTEGQLSNLANRVRDAQRPVDILFLSIGGNDIGFAGLVADVIVNAPVERWLLSAAKEIVTPQQASAALTPFARAFADLRRRLAPIVAQDLSRVVFVPYGSPMRHGVGGQLCPATRRGFDAHPAFSVDAAKLQATDAFVENQLTPLLEQLAKCGPSDAAACLDSATQTMAFADSHRPAFRAHGLCARSDDDPDFDGACLRDGDTFKLIGPDALEWPFRHCAPTTTAFAPYAPRARWSRTVNDSFMTAMSFVDTLPRWLRPLRRNDGLWGMTSMLLGGAVHPTAEGHAAMADAALIEAVKALAARGL